MARKATPTGSYSPVTRPAFKVAPDVEYSLIFPALSATNSVDPSSDMEFARLEIPVISEAFTVAPEVVYSPIEFDPWFKMKRFDPESIISVGPARPEIKAALTRVPEVVYSLMVPMLLFATNMRVPEIARLTGLSRPVSSEELIAAPELSNTPIAPCPSPGPLASIDATKMFDPEKAISSGLPKAVIKAPLIRAPEVVYSLMVLSPCALATKRSDPDTTILPGR